MQNKKFKSFSLFIVLLILVCLFQDLANAQQVETSVECDEANEPITMNYGNHTTGCEINLATDLDRFNFEGSTNDIVRIIVRSTKSNGYDPVLELRDPNGDVIEETGCNGEWDGRPACTATLNKSLLMAGTYSIAISDFDSNEIGSYTLQIEKFPPVTNVPIISYNTTNIDEINPVTDIDFYTFNGIEGTDVRITVLSTKNNGYDPVLELRDPNGAIIEETGCNGEWEGRPTCSFSIDKRLDVTGIYELAISDFNYDEFGSYQINIQCIFGDCFLDNTNTSSTTTTTTTTTVPITSTTLPDSNSLNDGLVAYYPFNGNANDESGNGNHGTVNGASLTEDRFSNVSSAYDFDGNSFILVNDDQSLDFSGNFSIAFWIQGINTADKIEIMSKRRICNQDPFFDIRQSSHVNGVVELEISNGTSNPQVHSSAINDGLWHHLVFVREGTILKSFTDQILTAENDTGNHFNIVNNEPLQFSNGPCIGIDGTVRLDGKLDDIRIYNRALSDSEIQQLFNGFSTTTTLTGNTSTTTTTTISSTTTTTIPNPDSVPIAEFDADPITGFEPLTVKFTDKSINNPTSWSWSFGDGGTSSEQNPTHTYQEDGVYAVSLTATNSSGSDKEDKPNLINVKDVAECSAAFNADKTVGFAPLEVSFTDLSTGNPTSWSWEFGDGGTSSEQNPTHVYQVEGIFTVKLTVSGSISCGTDVLTQTNLITVKSSTINAEFNANPTAGFAPLPVQFNSLSTGVPSNFSWLFGDGGSSSEENPLYTYNTPGIYTVTLFASGTSADQETKTNLINVQGGKQPTSEFQASPLTGFGPMRVQFTDTSTGNITNWNWDFGDGAISLLQNPAHEYKNPGFYNVKLTVSGSGGTGQEEKINLVNVLDGVGPTAAFSAEPLTGNAPFIVHFFDQSSGEVSNHSWNFGDGGTSSEQNPVYTYNSTGSFNVTLTVSGKDGTDNETKTGLITVQNGTNPSAGFTADQRTKLSKGLNQLRVKFSDLSSSPKGSILKREWNFGDGTTSDEANPEHTYTGSNDDAFTVSLTVRDSQGVDTITKQSFISLEDPVESTPSPTPTPGASELNALGVTPEIARKSLLPFKAVVTALDLNNNPIQGVNIEAAVNGASIFVNPSSAVTGSDGTASFNFRFGFRSNGGEITFSADGKSVSIKQQ